MLNLTADQRRALRAQAHALNPVVSISQNGLTDSVLQEIGISLASHQLIKIRVFNDDRALREQFLGNICEQLDAAPVQHIGKLLVIWRPAAEGQAPKPRRTRSEPRRTKRSFQGSSRT
jgi:RNA-binding protein